MSEERAPRWERRPEERPQALLDAAVRLFTTRGYRATRLEEVAAAAGVTKGTIYYYFGGKEELLRQSVEAYVADAFAGIERASTAAGAHTEERLRATLHAAWERWLRPETARLFRLLTGELRIELPDAFDAAMRAGPMHIWRLVAAILRDGKRCGEVADDIDPESAARFIASGLMQQALLHADFLERGLATTGADRLFEGAMGVALRGVAPRDRPPRARA
ncbi:MAG TPA: helix-turn-helix domain-containing protein [Gemmatimonadaceae bacterium]|nr:helix-turn-helix domain-containing protein [Gemmatimonadaceae bacterium]